MIFKTNVKGSLNLFSVFTAAEATAAATAVATFTVENVYFNGIRGIFCLIQYSIILH
jgi:hypothetical protein